MRARRFLVAGGPWRAELLFIGELLRINTAVNMVESIGSHHACMHCAHVHALDALADTCALCVEQVESEKYVLTHLLTYLLTE